MLEYKKFKNGDIIIDGKQVFYYVDRISLNGFSKYRTNILDFNLYYYAMYGPDLFNFVIAHRKELKERKIDSGKAKDRI